MSLRTKQVALNFLKAFNFVGIIVVIFLIFLVLGRINDQAKSNGDNLQGAVAQIKKDHDFQNNYLRCLANLFLASNNDSVTAEQTAFCLENVRKDATVKNTVIEPTPANGQTTTTTTTAQSTPRTENNQPQTTSAPPEPESEQQLPSQEPSLIEQLTKPLRGIL